MQTVKDYSQEVFGYIQALNTVQQPDRFSWKLERVIKSYQQMYERFCPHKVGDRVILIKTPEIGPESRPGWLGSKHFLIAGAVATVSSADFNDGNFVFGLEFDDDSGIHFQTGERIASETNGVYHFADNWVESLTAN
jgi:hypothetical protein